MLTIALAHERGKKRAPNPADWRSCLARGEPVAGTHLFGGYPELSRQRDWKAALPLS
jgi:hypothetical protein